MTITIDHRRTSANHPEADGLAERCVLTVKRSICRCIEDQQILTAWDEHLPYLQVGYNYSKQNQAGITLTTFSTPESRIFHLLLWLNRLRNRSPSITCGLIKLARSWNAAAP